MRQASTADDTTLGRRAILGRRRQCRSTRRRAEEESTFHHYTGNAIPWFVRGDLDRVLVLRDRLRGDLAAAGTPVRIAVPAMTHRATATAGLRLLPVCPCPRAGGAGAAVGAGEDEQPSGVTAAWAAGWPPRSSRRRARPARPAGMLTRLGLSIFFTMNVMAFTMALWTTDVYGPARPASRLLPVMHGLFRYLVLLFSLPVLACWACPFRAAPGRACAGASCRPTALLASGVGARVRLLVPVGVPGRGPDLLRGRLRDPGDDDARPLARGDRQAEGRPRRSMPWRRLLPDRVRRLGPDGQEELVPLEEVRSGDRLRVLPGERFPADGRVARNAGLVDEQVLTGESRPVLKEPGDRILGGTLNLDGDLIDRGDRGAGRGHARPGGRAGPPRARVQGALSAAGRPGLDLVRPGGGGGRRRWRSCVHWAFGSLEQRAHGRPGGRADRLPVRPGAGHAPGRLERARPGGEPAGPVPQRRGARAAGRRRGGPVRQDRDPHDRRGGCLHLPLSSTPRSERAMSWRSRALAGVLAARSVAGDRATCSRRMYVPGSEHLPICRGSPRARASEWSATVDGDGSETSISLGSPLFMDERGLHLGPAICARPSRTPKPRGLRGPGRLGRSEPAGSSSSTNSGARAAPR